MKIFNPSIEVVSEKYLGYHFNCLDYKIRIQSSWLTRRDRFFKGRYFSDDEIQSSWWKVYFTHCGMCKLKNRCNLYSFEFVDFLKKHPTICTHCNINYVHPYYVYVFWRLRDFMEFKFYCCRCFRLAFHKEKK